MAIRFGNAPPEVFEGLRRDTSRLGALLPRDRVAATAPSSITAPEGVESFVLRRAAIANGQGLESAEQSGWRVRTAPGVIAELRAVAADEYRVAHRENARLAASFEAVMEATSSIARLPDGDYELRALFAPEFALMCAWLHGGRDFIVPLPGSFYLEVWTAYTPDEFVTVLREVASNLTRYQV